jgi:hypothetical protein
MMQAPRGAVCLLSMFGLSVQQQAGNALDVQVLRPV